MTKKPDPSQTIAFQGAPGAYSDLACRRVFPAMTTLPCAAFEDAFAAVREGQAALGMIPIENSVAGRVADIHHLMPESGLFIIGEHFERVNHHLLGLTGATLDTIRTVRSHVHALSQCRNFIRAHGLTPVVAADTAGSAAEIAQIGRDHADAVAVVAFQIGLDEMAGDDPGLALGASGRFEDPASDTVQFVGGNLQHQSSPRSSCRAAMRSSCAG